MATALPRSLIFIAFVACGYDQEAITIAHETAGVYQVEDLPRGAEALRAIGWEMVLELEAAGDLDVEIVGRSEFGMYMTNLGRTMQLRSDTFDLPDGEFAQGIWHELTHYRDARNYGGRPLYRCITQSMACAGAIEIAAATTSINVWVAAGFTDESVWGVAEYYFDHFDRVSRGEEPWIVALGESIITERTEAALEQRRANN